MSDKRQFVKDLAPGAALDGELFLVLAKDRQLTRANKPYLVVTLADRSGSIEARLWDDADHWAARFERGDAVSVQARASEYQGKLQLKLDGLERVAPEAAPWELLVPASRYDPAEMEAELRGLVASMDEPWVRALCQAFLDDRDLMQRFTTASAAKSIHHAWRSGLLEHTLQVMRVCERLAALYPAVNRSLVLAGAFLHDVGKLAEMTALPAVEYTDHGRLVGHLAIGIGWIAERARALPGFPPDLVWHLQHLLASHHGTREQGAVVLPQTLEAELLSLADLLDSRMAGYQQALADAPADPSGRWTRYLPPYERALYRGPRDWRAVAPPPASQQGVDGLAPRADAIVSAGSGVAAPPRSNSITPPLPPASASASELAATSARGRGRGRKGGHGTGGLFGDEDD